MTRPLEQEVDTVLHCGDIGTAEVVALFAPWPTHFVFGNCDVDLASLEEAIAAIGGCCHGEFGDLLLEDVRIALLHSHDQPRFRDAIQSGRWQVICYGHTHVAATDRQHDCLLINPGAIYRANPHSIALLELPTQRVTHIEV